MTMMRSPILLTPPTIVHTPAQQLLIPPFERSRFTMLFVLATGLGWFLISLVLHAVPNLLGLQHQGLLAIFVTGLVSGLMVSACQWLVLRRYLPDWLWILASTTGYILLTLTLESWWGRFAQVLSQPTVMEWANKLPAATVPIASALLRSLLAAVSALWLGLTQWLCLRYYTRSNLWWIGIPPLAVLLSAALTTLNVWLPTSPLHLTLDTNVLGAGILGITQAIGFCALYKQARPERLKVPACPVAQAPEMLDYAQVKSLKKQLQRQLNRAWTSEHLNEEVLMYRVGVTESGAIVGYTPINPPAIEQVNQTPLPSLTVPEAYSMHGKQPSVARFEVYFLPSGRLRIQSWRSSPLLWVAAEMLMFVLVGSAIAAHLGTALLT
ncbi:hypothetical protein [Leptodesmis sp.]|uniref:hypothetical protein n=1 Tax=Leptodesmis sp. TaxID=3100501 RepID=UPI0040535B7A